MEKTHHYWTTDDIAIMKQAITDGMRTKDMRERYWPYRTFDSVKHKRSMVGYDMRNGKVTRYRAPVRATDLKLEPLQYTRECCPRVTFDEAREWMRNQKPEWSPTGDRKRDWQMINAARLFGPVPVPPFLPRAA